MELLWFGLHVANLAIVITVLSHTWEQFALKSLVLHLHDPLYPIENIPFPGVAICSNNRISYQAAINYAKELSLLDPQNRSATDFFRNITYFNSLYYKFQREYDFAEYELFQSFLDNYGTNANETYFNIRKTIKMLTPNCDDLIVKCLLNGNEINCFGKDAFQKAFTMYGPCCAFNTKNSFGKRNSTFRLTNSEQGLTVLLNSSHSDDLVSLLDMDAYIVIVYNPDGFPDIGSGNAIEVFPTNNVESLIGVTARYMDTSKKLKTFDSSYRKCFFTDETSEPDSFFRKKYSFSNCVMNCRIRSISALCNCVPFFVPVKLMENIGVPYCNLNHVYCLKRYDFKWRNVLTQRVATLGLEREAEEALYCHHCLPSCDDTQYDISMMSLPTDRLPLLDNVGIDFNLKLKKMSVLRVYFAASSAVYYKRVIINDWQEAFSTVGNILSIFLGFSLVAIVEIVFFSIKHLYIALKVFISNNSDNNRVLKTGVKIKKNNLYILP